MSVVEKYAVFCDGDAPWRSAQKPYVRRNYIAELITFATTANVDRVLHSVMIKAAGHPTSIALPLYLMTVLDIKSDNWNGVDINLE